MIHPTAIIYDGVHLGRNVHIGPYCVIGAPPEHRDFYDKPGRGVIIGDDVRIMSHVTIDSGITAPTAIGDSVVIFNHSHIAHDCHIWPSVTIGGGVSLAGHTKVMYMATVSGKSCTFQRVVIGPYAFVCGMSYVIHNVGIANKVAGMPAKYVGDNIVGLSRANTTLNEVVKEWSDTYAEISGS